MRQKIYLLLIFGLFIALAGGQQDDLVQAARRGDTVKIEEILKSGISVNTHDSDGRAALHEAAATENVKLFKLLIAAGADIRATDNKGVTPEFIVLQNGSRVEFWRLMMVSQTDGGRSQVRRSGRGTPIPTIDAMIAATALHHGLTVVSRNVDDFRNAEVSLLNPWAD